MQEEHVMIIPETYHDLYVVGDIHGEIRELVYNLTERYKLQNSVIIIAGDVGIGFESQGYYENIYNRVKEKLEDHNLLILGVRGNHDDPEYYNGQLRIDYDHFKTLADYTKVRMGGKEVLVIGGANSVDQEWRQQENQRLALREKSQRVWWPTEEPVYLGDKELQELPGREYCIVSHDAPISMLPVLLRDESNTMITEEIYEGTLRVRKYLEKILWQCKPYRWYYGHHHESHSESNGVTQSRCLAIQELIRVPLEEDYEIKENPETHS